MSAFAAASEGAGLSSGDPSSYPLHWRMPEMGTIVDPSTRDQRKHFLRALFDAALGAADARHILPRHLPPPPRGRTVVVGAGKAAAAMARAVEDHWPGTLSGVVITRYGHGVPCRRIEIR